MLNHIAYLLNSNGQIIPASVTALPGTLPATINGAEWQYAVTPSDWTPSRKHRAVHAAQRGEMLQLQQLIKDAHG